MGCVAALLFGQQRVPPDEMRMRNSPWVPPVQYTLRTETRVVEVGVVVRDSRSHAVGGLTRDDFEIEDLLREALARMAPIIARYRAG